MPSVKRRGIWNETADENIHTYIHTYIHIVEKEWMNI